MDFSTVYTSMLKRAGEGRPMQEAMRSTVQGLVDRGVAGPGLTAAVKDRNARGKASAATAPEPALAGAMYGRLRDPRRQMEQRLQTLRSRMEQRGVVDALNQAAQAGEANRSQPRQTWLPNALRGMVAGIGLRGLFGPR